MANEPLRRQSRTQRRLIRRPIRRKKTPQRRKLPKKLHRLSLPVKIEASQVNLMSQSIRDASFKKPRTARRSGRASFYLVASLLLLVLSSLILGQAGRKPHATTGGILLGITAKRADNSSTNITSKNVSVYDNGVEQ